MKHITILLCLMSFAFMQEQDWDLQRGYDYRGLGEEIEATPLLDFELRTPAAQCFQILINFQDGWLDNMFKIKDSMEIICPNMIDVRIEYEGIIQDYTMDEFLKRLGFNNE